MAISATAPATVVIEPGKGRHRILLASEKARAQGVTPGLNLSAAFAVSRALTVLERSPEAERQELVSLAQWTRRITPTVSLEPPHALLLEIRGSLKLWGGIDSIREMLRNEFYRRRITAHICIAPTALAALWLARDQREDVLSHEGLVSCLGDLPLRVTGWTNSALELLGKMGIDTIGDCLRLPRDGLVRRVGRQCLEDLDRSLGRCDPRPEFRPARRFRSTVQFQDEITEPETLANAGRELIGKLAGALRRHQVRVETFEFGFHHAGRAKTVEHINLTAPTHEPEKVSRLFLGKLERMVLPAPVTALSLATGRAEPMVGRSRGLFPARSPATLEAAGGELIDRLRLRFGPEEIYGVVPVDDHRPERAWSKSLDPLPCAAPGIVPEACADHGRPLWILSAPVRLSSDGDLPRDPARGDLRLESGPERIEAGWWEGQDVSRDYYVACAGGGEKLWVYRDRRSSRRWYLHGVFG